MLISMKWLNRYLEANGGPAIAAPEADELLTHLGFPIEETTETDAGDTVLDVEVTSNRGDVLSHIGCAREICASDAKSQAWALDVPSAGELPRDGGPVGDVLSLENREPDTCPLFTAHVVRKVRVGPSPQWLVELLEAVGQRSINNLVDITNFITHELGNPCHVFDLKKLAGSKLIIRHAADGEELTTLDGKKRTLKPADLVVADEQRAQSLAGVMGGLDSEVDESTTDVVFEMATWDPVAVRTAARRLAIRTDASYRFERGVHPLTIADAAERAVALVRELAGGDVCEGMLAEGGSPQPPHPIELSTDRVCSTIGLKLAPDRIAQRLEALEISVERGRMDEGVLVCTPPAFRLDLTRPIDLIEEVARTVGFDQIPMSEKLPIRVRHPQERERARREIAGILTGLGFYETITFSFATPERAAMFIPEGLETASVDDERRGAEPTLRPSVIPSLLNCRRVNDAGGVRSPGGVRLFERSAVFAQSSDRKTVEHTNYAMLADIPGVTPGKKPKPEQLQHGYRLIRGAVEQLVREMGGTDADFVIEAGEPHAPAYEPGAFARILLNAEPAGYIGVPTDATRKAFDLDVPVVVCEINATVLEGLFPPSARVEALPAFPAIERDLSLVVGEQVAWGDIASLVDDVAARGGLEFFAGCELVSVYRGKQIGDGRKSVTARVRFQHAERTLTHDEVDPQIDHLVKQASSQIGAEIRE